MPAGQHRRGVGLTATGRRALASGSGAAPRRTLLELLPADTIVIEEAAGARRRRGGSARGTRRSIISRSPGAWARTCPAASAILEQPEALARATRGVSPAHCCATSRSTCSSASSRRRRSIGISTGCASLLAGSPPTLILCDNEGQLERLEELLEEGARGAARATLAIGALDGGFVMPSLRVLTDHEIFRRARRLRRPRRYRQAAPSAATGALTDGDYVVHLDHGIGIYRGHPDDHGGRVHPRGGHRRVRGRRPAQRAALPARPAGALPRRGRGRRPPAAAAPSARRRVLAAGAGDAPARRSSRWRRSCSISTPAAPSRAGYAFPPDTKWQRELESSFLYEDTPDQRKATEEVKRDMERPLPMDRLLVGDVGYGKTEVAVRAAFKAVQGGKQVAVLVPTTILAEQHGRTFTRAAGGLPGARSRSSPASARPRSRRPRWSGWRRAQIDIVIGTHRLLSKDVDFKDLGLLVVDEEHRFGVKHKERLKALRLSVDVLTLTATPIPRTLHLSLAGLRDLTLIETAPRDRSPDPDLRRALGRRAARGGVRPRDRPRRPGVHGAQPDRDHRDDRRPGARARAPRAASAWPTARCRPRSWRR